MVKMKLRHLNIGKTITDVQSDEIIKRLLVQECKTLVRIYIVGAFNLAQRDNDSESDPFVILKLGDKVFNERKNY